MIVDEEQRFGVEHKEALKKLRTNVDVLAMTATPIPRTLEMSLTGHPRDVHAGHPAGGPAPDADLCGRVQRTSRWPPRSGASCMREGQVFYVHNRVSSIERTCRADRSNWCPRPGWPWPTAR